jgi:1-acyl-sn-glycerol-3-phosphate acyltransferase
MAKIAILKSQGNLWAETLGRVLCGRHGNEYYFAGLQEFCEQAESLSIAPCCLYAPAFSSPEGVDPDLGQAEAVLQQLGQLKSGTLVLISSALIYGAGPGRQAFATEEYSALGNGRNRICDQWTALERLAHQSLHRNVRHMILRPVTVLPSPALFSRLLSRKLTPTLPGHDPVLQFLSLDDLAEAIDRAFARHKPGVFNIAPDGVTPLCAAIRIAGGHRLPIPRTLQRLARNSEVLDYLRYSWTVANEKAKRELGFVPAKSSTEALLELRGDKSGAPARHTQFRFDDFGMDKKYIQSFGRTLFPFLNNFYWRVEHRGLEHVPRHGRAVLVGIHRGFMPWDGFMALHLLVQKTGRYPRFLTHPGLLRFPFFFNFVTRLGGVIASQQSADRILRDEGLLGIFPEGVQGAFTSYRNAYQLKEFGRDAFVKIALRNRAPIVPFVTVGSAEALPILGKIKSRLWTRYTDWPCFPLTPTFPLLPVPLPSKWHTQFLPAISVEQYPPEAARNSTIVKAISHEVRTKMQQAINAMLARRHSIFFGSVFEAEAKAEAER